MASRPLTLYEKVWAAHVVEQRDDGTCLIYIDRHLVHEVTSPQAFEGLRVAGRGVRRPDLTLAVPDHNLPTTARRDAGGNELPIADRESAAQLEALRRNVADFGVPYIDALAAEQGIVHVVGPEQGFTLPGTTLVCGDSHTSAHGALGALAFGIGTSEVEHVLATQTLLLSQSKTMEVRVDGTLGFGVSPKDVILAIVGRIGAAGGTGHVIEYTGSVIREMSIEGRLTVANMSIEAGARAGMIAPDETTFAYLEGRPMAPAGEEWDRAVAWWRTLSTDAAARYDRTVKIAASDIAPGLTWGTSPEDVVAITGAVPAPESFADPSKQGRGEEIARLYGARRGHADAGRRNPARVHRIVHQQPHRGLARGRIGRQRSAGGRWGAGDGGAGIGAGEAAGRGRGARSYLHRGGLRMARAGLFDVPGDEPGQGARWRALRVDEQPQFRRAAGAGCANASAFAGDGGGGGGDRAIERRA